MKIIFGFMPMLAGFMLMLAGILGIIVLIAGDEILEFLKMAAYTMIPICMIIIGTYLMRGGLQ